MIFPFFSSHDVVSYRRAVQEEGQRSKSEGKGDAAFIKAMMTVAGSEREKLQVIGL
jgi:hypothetical protein